MANLHVRGKGFPVNPRGTAVGRVAAPEVQVVIDDSTVSRVHAVLRRDAVAGTWTVCDQGSTNGTLINGVPCVPHQDEALPDRAHVQFGEVLAEFSSEDAQGVDRPSGVAEGEPTPYQSTQRQKRPVPPEVVHDAKPIPNVGFLDRHAMNLVEDVKRLEHLRVRLHAAADAMDGEGLRALVHDLVNDAGELTELTESLDRTLADFRKLLESAPRS